VNKSVESFGVMTYRGCMPWPNKNAYYLTCKNFLQTHKEELEQFN